MDKGINDIMESAQEFEDAYLDRLMTFIQMYNVEESYYINDEIEFWNNLLCDLKDPVATYEGFGLTHMPNEIELAYDLSDPKRLIIETEKKIKFLTFKQKAIQQLEMEYSVESFCEPGFQYIKNYPSRLKSFISESEADVYDFIESELNVWEPVLDFIEDQSRLNEKKAYPIFYENLQKAINLLTEQMVSFYTSKKIGFLNEKKIAMKLKDRNPSTDNLMGLLKNIKNAPTKFYVKEPPITDDLPKDDKNNPLTFFEYIFDNGGLDVLLIRIIPSEEEINDSHLRYVDDEFAFYKEVNELDGSVSEVKVELSINLNNNLNDKLLISRMLVEDRMGELGSDNDRFEYIKLIITRLFNLENAVNRLHLNPKFGINSKFFRDYYSKLFIKYEIYLSDEYKKVFEKKYFLNETTAENKVKIDNPIPKYHLKNYMTEDQWDKFLHWLVCVALVCNSDGTTNHKRKNNWFLPLISRVLIERGYYNPAIKLPIVKDFAHICNITFKPNLLATPHRAEALKRNKEFTYTLPDYTLREENK